MGFNSGFKELKCFLLPFVSDPNAGATNSIQGGFFSLNQGFSRL